MGTMFAGLPVVLGSGGGVAGFFGRKGDSLGGSKI